MKKDWAGFAKEMATGSDRAAALLGGAWLDVRLRALLERFFVDDQEVVATVFESNGVLEAFGGRIRLAYCLGLISRPEFDDLVWIQNIRNAFAHELHNVTFADPWTVEACANLRTFKQRPAFALAGLDLDARRLYEVTVAGLANVISRRTASASRERRTVPAIYGQGTKAG
jgi:DNA-binding MltR family transcriptional regulator